MSDFANLVSEARKLFDEQEYKEATKMYHTALDYAPNDKDRATIWAEICWTCYKEKSFQLAIEAAENVLEHDPDYKGEDDLYRLMGYSYFALENDEKAEEFLLKSLNIDQDSEKQMYVCYELGKLYFRNQRYLDAEKYFDKSDEYFKNNAHDYWISMLFFKGFSKYYLQKTSEAEQFFNQLIDISKDEPIAQSNGLYGLAFVYFDRKNYLDTINTCEKVTKLNPNFFDMESLGFLIAASFFYLGRYDVFEKYYEQITKSFEGGRYFEELSRLYAQIPKQNQGPKN